MAQGGRACAGLGWGGWDGVKNGAETIAYIVGKRLESATLQKILSEDERQAINFVTGHTGARDWNKINPGVCRVVHGMANRGHRIKALGNGQVPLCAAAAWLILAGQVDHIGEVTAMVERGG